MLTRKFVIHKLNFPVDGYRFDVQIMQSVDGGNTFWYSGFGRFCRSEKECREFIARKAEEYAREGGVFA